MATKKEVAESLKIALKEIGSIIPWYDKKFECWVFSHSLYPSVEYDGDSQEEVIQNYPLYLRDFIEERLKGNLALVVEKETKGRGGARFGAGRPRKAHKIETKSLRLTEPIADVAKWLRKHPEAIPEIQKLMQKYARSSL